MSTVKFDIELLAYFNHGYSPETEVEIEVCDDDATEAVEKLCARHAAELEEIAQELAEIRHEAAIDDRRIAAYEER